MPHPVGAIRPLRGDPGVVVATAHDEHRTGDENGDDRGRGRDGCPADLSAVAAPDLVAAPWTIVAQSLVPPPGAARRAPCRQAHGSSVVLQAHGKGVHSSVEVGLDRALRDAERGRSLGGGAVEEVAQHDTLPLPRGS